MNFQEKWQNAVVKNKSFVCVGLDPDPALMPRMGIYEFLKLIVDNTADLVCAYKPNLAFYESLGLEGLQELQKIVKYIPENIPVIGDGKRGDIGNTSRMYARFLFETFNFDAVTVNPYLGYDSVEPFLRYKDRQTFLLCRTSNPGAADFQSLVLKDGKSLFEQVALKASEWNEENNVGLVVGATYIEELKKVRQICPDMVFLIPGVGAQGGDLQSVVKYGRDSRGSGIIINSSRQILYASRGMDFTVKAREAALKLREEINRLL